MTRSDRIIRAALTILVVLLVSALVIGIYVVETYLVLDPRDDGVGGVVTFFSWFLACQIILAILDPPIARYLDRTVPRERYNERIAHFFTKPLPPPPYPKVHDENRRVRALKERYVTGEIPYDALCRGLDEALHDEDRQGMARGE